MMSNTKTSRNIYFAFLTVFLTAALFTGCGKNESDHHAGEKTSENDAASGEMTVILPGNVALTMVKVEAGTFEMSARDKLTEDYKKDNAQLPFVIVDDEGNIDDDAMLSLLFENEMPHQATLTRDFYIGRTEVTQAQWKAVMGSNPSHFIGDDRPVEQVSWYNAMVFTGGDTLSLFLRVKPKRNVRYRCLIWLCLPLRTTAETPGPRRTVRRCSSKQGLRTQGSQTPRE